VRFCTSSQESVIGTEVNGECEPSLRTRRPHIENLSKSRFHKNLNTPFKFIVRGDFFEHGRHFGFRRFWNDQWVFLTAWDSCTAWAWINVAPGVWAWTPIDICIG
jgi:hypothetical protein